MNDLQAVLELDRALIAPASEIKVLSALAWPGELQEVFLANWRTNPTVPAVTYRQPQLSPFLLELERITREAGALDHPLAAFVQATAQSYLTAGQMLEKLGTDEVTGFSQELYGSPGDALSGGGGTTSLGAAIHFMGVAREFFHNSALMEADICLSAQVVQQEMQRGLQSVFSEGQIKVVVDGSLASKAAAGATRIRLRDATCFTEYDAEQLLQHEAFVHSLTALNGQAQQNLTSLSLGSPRTTATQEGLATFAEMITGSIDMARLERIAMRVIAIDMALRGADFIEVFKYFIDAGQPEVESYNSTVRVFRGAPLTGGHAFTKDAVYLPAMLEVHTFFRWALKTQQLGLCQHLFAGRLTLKDVVSYAPFFTDGTLQEPRYLPPWMNRSTGLGGYLAISVFANSIDLDNPFEVPAKT